jgi:hypothetical protein
MPPFDVPTIYIRQPIISMAVIRKDYIAGLKKKIFDGVLWSKTGSVLAQIGSCDQNKAKVDSEVTQEALDKLRDELGVLGISTTIITGELDLTSHRYPVYIFASNGGGSGAHKTKVSRSISGQR